MRIKGTICEQRLFLAFLPVQSIRGTIAKQALRLTAALENIFDTRYADHATVRHVVNGEEVTTLDAGRNLRLSAEWQF